MTRFTPLLPPATRGDDPLASDGAVATRPPRGNALPVLAGGPLRHVVVIGGGIAGLAAAYRLTRLDPPVAVTLIEAEQRLGGKILTEQMDGFTIEGGPDSFLSVKPRGVGLCAELGLVDSLQGTTPRPHRAFVRRGDRLHELPEGLTGLVPTRLGPILRSGLLSPWGKARFVADAVLPASRDERDESLAHFVRRRLGREVYARLVEPLMAGIYAGDGEQLSLTATFPRLREGERAHGGLIRGVLASRAAASRADGAPSLPPFVTPSTGLGTLVDALARELRTAHVKIALGTLVDAVERGASSGSDRYQVQLATGDAIGADGIVVAVPAFAAAALLAGFEADLATALDAIPHASSAIVSLAYPESDIPRALDAHGYVIPRVEGRAALACTWTSAKWRGRAPDGMALIRVFLGRFGQEPLLADDDALVATARAELQETLGVAVSPALTRVHRWPNGMPQYTMGHLDRLATIERSLAGDPAIALAGAAYRGVGIPDCIESGEAAAVRVHAWSARLASRA